MGGPGRENKGPEQMGEKKEGRARQEGKKRTTVEAHNVLRKTLSERENKINDWSRQKHGPSPRNEEPDESRLTEMGSS